MVIHFASVKFTACNLPKTNVSSTNNPDRVTCATCKNSAQFKERRKRK